VVNPKGAVTRPTGTSTHGVAGAHGGLTMLYYALVFLIVGLIAGALGLAGIAAIAGQIAWVLFLIGVVLVVIHLVTGRRVPPAL
jgi:uncharacterized membrane protein YtjA (UPF0391 family)